MGPEYDGDTSMKVKHIFEVQVKELRNVAILKKIIKDIRRGYKNSNNKDGNKYIQDVFLSHIFPLDDEKTVSEFIEYSPRSESTFDYKVSMHSYHTYVLVTGKSIGSILAACGECFTIKLSCLKDEQEMNIGNAQIAIEDLIELAENYENQGGNMENKIECSKRKLVLYGTSFSQRENCIIGKLDVDFIYRQELIETFSNRQPGISISNDVYLLKEVYMNRKIPLNGYLNINIGEITELRQSLDNINHLISRYNDPDPGISLKDRTLYNSFEDLPAMRTGLIDKARALSKIYMEGLNLGVVASIFSQTPELKQRFKPYSTQVVFQTLYPNFQDEYEYRLKMDMIIFEHLKFRAAVFEIRHYFVRDPKTLLDLGKDDAGESDANSDSQTENRDYITLGYAKVPLVNLITKSYGVDQNVPILDDFNQKLGYLRIRMSLNYESKKKLAMYKEPAEKPIEGQYMLGFSFVELISHRNRYLQNRNPDSEIKHLVFKFK